jgi:hypothetical protein
MRIQVLSLNDFYDVKDCSPTLRDLRDKSDNLVKNRLELFEKKPWCLKTGCNWWLSPKREAAFDFPVKSSIADESCKLNEILMAQERHVLELKNFMGKITEAVKCGRGFIAMKLRDYTFTLYGGLKTIYSLHKDVILPRMSDRSKCIEIISLLLELIDEGHFYCFISHKILEKMMNKILTEYIFMVENPVTLPKPFRILEFYYSWTSNICNELMKSPSGNSDDIAVCVEVEKKLIDLMDSVADAEAVTEIAQITDVPFEVQLKVFDILKKQEDIIDPILLLVPKKDFRVSYRYPVILSLTLEGQFLLNFLSGQIDMMRLGKFIKTFDFPMISKDFSYENNSKFFVFEKCVIYTSVIHAHKFCFENIFWMKNIMFGLSVKEKIFAELTNNNHTIQVDDPRMIPILREQKMRHWDDEISAEIDTISDYDLIKLVDSVEDSKKWRRHSVVNMKL